ncbi:UV DNA damage repair endonuclease UvsE [Aureibacillus halotolerans]|uniref:UV-damage endonuclease n=1 Tax=Aureibacillus halotolerans TaxID=1508390 RepID=A0A4R6U0M0_9BACI|nr:UV DNA damage repair endonuclease UvsE [Aureibacillus halotolerans]TDQ38762.1 UV-damage endonuclease [Aureibacillus halotolerans]
MRIRFGYVANNLSLWDGSPSSTMTFRHWSTLSAAERQRKLEATAAHNLETTLRILHYNVAQGIPLYRMSSSLIPLATHPEVQWDYSQRFQTLFREIGTFSKTHQLRLSMHPNQFTLFTSDRDDITANAISDMLYHQQVFEQMELSQRGVINIHVGGAYGDKKAAIERFYSNLSRLPKKARLLMTLENDDRTYNAEETLAICQQANIPMVFDYHHHKALPSERSLEDLLPSIFATWKRSPFKPKVHLSSPRNAKEFRKHAEFVDPAFVRPFFHLATSLGIEFDVMIEAKQKEQALLALLSQLEKERRVKRLAGGVLDWPTP